MNLRQVWTEIFQKPAGRLLLFLLIGGIFLAFILLRRGPQPKPDNTQVAHQATQAKSYSFDEDIPAAAPCAVHASGANVRQGGSRYTNTKTAATHSPDDLRHEGAVRQRIVSAVWTPASLRVGQHSRFHQYRHSHHRPGHRGRLERRTAYYPGWHGSSWSRPKICRPRTHRLRPAMVPGLSGRTRTSRLRHCAGLRARSEEAQCLERVRRLGRTAWVFRQVRQVCRGEGDPCLR